jgi:hypothetical protein
MCTVDTKFTKLKCARAINFDTETHHNIISNRNGLSLETVRIGYLECFADSFACLEWKFRRFVGVPDELLLLHQRHEFLYATAYLSTHLF